MHESEDDANLHGIAFAELVTYTEDLRMEELCCHSHQIG